MTTTAGIEASLDRVNDRIQKSLKRPTSRAGASYLSQGSVAPQAQMQQHRNHRSASGKAPRPTAPPQDKIGENEAASSVPLVASTRTRHLLSVLEFQRHASGPFTCLVERLKTICSTDVLTPTERVSALRQATRDLAASWEALKETLDSYDSDHPRALPRELADAVGATEELLVGIFATSNAAQAVRKLREAPF